MRLLTSSPAPISNTTAIALSSTTSTLRVRLRCAPSLPLRPPSFSDSLRLSFIVRSAGARPNNTPVTSEIRRVKTRSEEHTSELQSRPHLVCRLLLEKKKHFDL